jgi:hypothetical protein
VCVRVSGRLNSGHVVIPSTVENSRHFQVQTIVPAPPKGAEGAGRRGVGPPEYAERSVPQNVPFYLFVSELDQLYACLVHVYVFHMMLARTFLIRSF